MTEKGINHDSNDNDPQDGGRPGQDLCDLFPDAAVCAAAGPPCCFAADEQKQGCFLHYEGVYRGAARYTADAAALRRILYSLARVGSLF